MSDKFGKLKGWQWVIVGLAMAAVYFVEDLTFRSGLAHELDAISARLCETVLNGMGMAVERSGIRLQATDPTTAFRLDFRNDGGWLLKQFYLLIPITVYFGFVFKRPMWKLGSIGVLAIAAGLCVRAGLLGFNAAAWGQEVAAGWLDRLIRMGVIVFAMLLMASSSSKLESTHAAE